MSCVASPCGEDGFRLATPAGYPPHVEPTEFASLGSISAEDDGLVPNLATAEESSGGGVPLESKTEIPSQILEKLGLPQP